MLRDAIGDTWDTLLPLSSSSRERSALVVLAPSGVGKTAELTARAAAAQESGTAAFFVRAVDLAVSGVVGAVHDAVRLRAWLSSTDRGIFFVDAVDEARLEGHDLEHVLLRFAQEVDPSTRAVQLVLSSRNDVWLPSDVRHIVRVLALPTETPPVRVVRLEPLSLDDVQVYAKANGVRDDLAFIRAVREEELDQLFDFRPPDAKVLVDYWKEHGAFGSWSEMLESSIEASVRNENRRHAVQQQFTIEEARSGLTRLGVATVLGKRSLISLIGTSNRQEVSAERLFADRRPASIAQLLAMGLFAHKGLHSVQLPQGAPSHFLAARWLGERARRGWDPRALEDTLFVKPFGDDETLIPPSRWQVVGWVAGLVPNVRKRLLRELPHVLLFEGDPAKLSRGECIETLRAVLADIRADRHDVSPTRGTVRQIAKHDIADAVVRLLREFAGIPKAEYLLLRIAEVGRYSEAASVALALALSPNTEEEVAQIAVRVASSVGARADREALLALSTHRSEWIRLALVQSLAPETLNGTALVELVASMTSREVAYLLGYALTEVGLADIDAILARLTPTLGTSNITAATESHLEVASRLVTSRLVRSPTDIPAWLPRLLLTIELHLAGPFYISSDSTEQLKTLVASRPDLRRAIWETRISSPYDDDAVETLLSPKLGPAQPEDFEWFWARREVSDDQTVQMAVRAQLAEALRNMSLERRSELLNSQHTPPEVKAYVDVSESEAAHFDALRRQHEAKRAAETAAARAKHIAEVQPLRAEIESGENAHALVWAWQRLTRTDDRRGRLGTARLVEAVGSELAEVFLTGFQRWWRRHDPAIRTPGNNEVLLIDLAGLTGISIDVERGLDFSTLTDVEVERAGRYALFELNGFPMWFDALLAAHPRQVRAILASVVRTEWQATEEHHGVIARAPYERFPTMELLREVVLEELEQGSPGHLRTAHDAVSVLIQSPRLARNVASLLERKVTAASDGDAGLLAEWLRGWSHFAPAQAANWLRQLASCNNSRFLDVIEQVAALLEADFSNRSGSISVIAWTAAALEHWVRLLHVAVRPEDDIDRVGTGVYSPGRRDRAQEFRSRCITQLAYDPSREAFEALKRIRRSTEMKPYLREVGRARQVQLTAAAEHLATPWTESDVLAVERSDERPPKNTAELFALVQRHLARVAELVENHDFSYAALFGEKTDEKEVQCWVASSLMLVSRGLYTVEREPEVQDDKLMDISISVPGVGRVPVEIKPLYAARYSYPQLRAFISDQLLGRYMRPAAVDRGIFLLVPLKSRTWRVDGRVLSFDEIRSKLAAHAATVSKKAFKEVIVASIDVAAARPAKGRVAKAAQAVRRKKKGVSAVPKRRAKRS